MDDPEARFFAERLKRKRQEFEAWLRETAQRLSSRHQIGEISAQRELLNALRGMILEHPSGPSFDPSNWSIPKGLTPWKEAKAKLTRFALVLGEARRLSDEIVGDDVMRGALVHVDTDRLPDLMGSLCELEQLAQEAAAIEGKKGNRPNPPWTREAARLCRVFWKQHKGEEPKRYFNPAKKPRRGERIKTRTTAPANAFSQWFCDVMEEVAQLTPSECDTILRRQ